MSNHRSTAPVDSTSTPYQITSEPRNGFGIAAIICAVVGLLFALIPLTGFIAFGLGATAVILALVGLGRIKRSKATNTKTTWTALVAGSLAVALGIWGMVTVATAVHQFDQDLSTAGRLGYSNPDKAVRDNTGGLTGREACLQALAGSEYAGECKGDSSEPSSTTSTSTDEMTVSQQNAIASANGYLDFSSFSRQGLIGQLASPYGDGFSMADATYAVNHIEVDWNAQAAIAAQTYLDFKSFSRAGLIGQLSSRYGDGFTHAQAVYGVNQTGL